MGDCNRGGSCKVLTEDSPAYIEFIAKLIKQ